MSYKYSQLDKKNLEWLPKNDACKTLVGIKLNSGEIRGLQPFSIRFKYPITAIAGENGSGKSTLLALAACAFHNDLKGFRLPERKLPYYTYSDFFIQFQGERSLDDVIIKYGIRDARWAKSESGVGWQTRQKKHGGRWTDYSTRVKRQVVYLGTQRIVPPYERSAHKSYQKSFAPTKIDDKTYEQISTISGSILGKSYDRVERFSVSKYFLAKASIGSISYSGFNMGAGECSVFDILFAIFAAGKGSLIVIDEIELGLHEQAQRRFINELKEICSNLQCQIICSTHSYAILDALPPEGRYYIKNIPTQKTLIIPDITSEWACGTLAGRNTDELDIFVEDKVASNILEISLPFSIRQRVNVIPIGSHDAILRVMSGRFLERKTNCMAILDGDRSTHAHSNISKVIKYTEPSDENSKNIIKLWANERIIYLPGNTWPELFLLKNVNQKIKNDLAEEWRIDSEINMEKAFDNVRHSEKHNEFYDLGIELCIDEEKIRTSVIRHVVRNNSAHFNPLTKKIEQILSSK